MFCNLFGGDFPEQPETNLSPTVIRLRTYKERENQRRKMDPELDAKHRARLRTYYEKEKQKRKMDPKLDAEHKARKRADREKTKQ